VNGLARHTDPDTSHEAAASIETTDLKNLVVGYLIASGPSSSEQISLGLGLARVTISPRLRPLCNEGRVREAGYAIASTGRRVIVWEAVE